MKQDLLTGRMNGCTGKIAALAARLWPGGWEEDYAPVLGGMAMSVLQQVSAGLAESQRVYRRVEQLLAETPAVMVRPGKEFWFGVLLFAGGPGLAPTALGYAGYLVGVVGLALLAAGCFRLYRATGEKINQERRREVLREELRVAGAALADRQRELAQLLGGLPVPGGFPQSAGGNWVVFLADLRKVCRERNFCQEKLGRLKRALEEWEGALQEVAAALPDPVGETPEGLVGELARQAEQALRRRREASGAREAVETVILPAISGLVKRRTEIEASITAVERGFRDLGGGDPADGQREWVKRKAALTRLGELASGLADIKDLRPLPGWQDAVRLEERLSKQLAGLKEYLELQKEREELLAFTADSGVWERFADYGSFVAFRESVLAEITGEVERLEERERRYLEIGKRLSRDDQLLSANADVIVYLHDNLESFRGWIENRNCLLPQIVECREEINSMVDQLWTGGWASGYPGSSGWLLEAFLDRLACVERLEDLLGQFVDSLKQMEEMHGRYRRCAAELALFQETVGDWNGKWRRVTAKVSSPALDDLCERLGRARARAREATSAREEFRERVWPGLMEARTVKSAIDSGVATLELELRDLGDGNLAEGVRLVREKKRSLSELAGVEKELAVCAAGLSLPPSHWSDASNLREEKTEELERTRASVNQIESAMPASPSFLDDADEPVQRFVLYGGDWVVKWLYACVALHRHHLGERIDLAPVIGGLPSRVFQELDDLVRSFREKDEPAPDRVAPSIRVTDSGKKPARGEKRTRFSEEFPRPELILDVERGELKLLVGGYRFRLYDPATAPEIYVLLGSGEESLRWKKEISLHGYLEDGMVKVRAVPCTVPVWAARYLVTVHTGGIKHEWPVRSFGDDAPFMLFSQKGRRIATNHLARQRAWLVYPADLAVDPPRAVLSEGRLLIAGRDLWLALIDFGRNPVIYLTSGGDRLHEIGVSADEVPSGPFLSDEETIPGAWTRDNRPVYVGDVPRLLLPLENAEDIAAWSIVVEGVWPDGAYERVVCGREIADLGVEDAGRLAVFLDEERLLGRRPVGEYSICLKREDRDAYRFDLAIFPGLTLFFERWLYLPREGDGGRIQLNVILPESLAEGTRVEAKDPARLAGRDGEDVRVETDAGSSLVGLELVYRVGGRTGRASVAVEVPGIRWRLRTNLEHGRWHDEVVELWHEDFCGVDNPRLEVTLPGHLPKPVEMVRVILDGGGHQVRGKLKKGIWEFDLAGLADSLRGGADVRSLTLVCENGQGREIRDGRGRLLTIRSRWRVADLCSQLEESPEGTTLRASWTDLGRPGSRVARLWSLEEPWASPLEVPVADDARALEHRFGRARLPAGSYLLNIAESDPWGDTARFPLTKDDCDEIQVRTSGMRVVVAECRWEERDVLSVSGTVTGVPAQVTVGVFSVIKGSPRVRWQKATTDENGRFSLLMENLVDKSLLKNYRVTPESARPHWLGFMVDAHEPVYHFELLSDPGGVGWPLGSTPALAGMEGLGGARLFIDCLEASLDQTILTDDLSKEFQVALHQGQNTVPLFIDIAEKPTTANLLLESGANKARLEMKTGAIICTTCQKIEPDQASWHANHSILAPKCKGFKYDVRKLVALLYWYWDTSPLLAALEGKYALAGRRPLMLFDNLARPLPDEVWSNREKSGFNLEKLIAALWEREVTLLAAAGR